MRDKPYTTTQFLRFLIPSLIGAAVFLMPIPKDGTITIVIGILSDSLRGLLKEQLPYIGMTIVSFSAIMTIFSIFLKPKWVTENHFLRDLFIVKPLWSISRLLGAILYVMVVFKIGPEFIWSMDTGGTPGLILIPILVALFVFTSFLIAPLTDFGFMEYVGTLARLVMKPLFTIPGRASIDCLASWLGSPSVGVVITRKMHSEGFYSGREASVISTTFSLVGIGYIYVMADFVGMPEMYFPLLFSTYVVSMIMAMIMPRIWPLSKKPDTYYDKETGTFNETGKIREDTMPENYNLHQWAVKTAVDRAQKSDLGTVWKTGTETLLTIYVSTLPLVMAWGTVVLIVATYTPVFNWLAYPFYLLLELVRMPEAYETAPAFILGFADQFLSAVIGAARTAPAAKFMCAGISITGLIYMTEVGVLILDSKIPMDFKDLLIVYVQRAVLTVFLLAPFAYWLT